MIPAGTVLGAYEVRSLIGAGGMGEVYRAHDRRLRRDVALKILPAALLGDPARHERFAQEARAASALSHPRIVAIFDVNLEGDPPYIVFELVEGASLRKTIERGPVPVRQLLDLATQIADGLSAAHKAGFAHRDLKPENILVTPEGRPKILDFGLAKQLGPLVSAGQETVTLPVTAARTVLGTVHYMSPEQARGEQVDIRSDIFSFGVILYEMATGKRPFDRASPVETLSAIISSDPPRIEVEIPLSLRLMIERCMAKDREERYHSTRDLWLDLRQQRARLGETVSIATGPVPTIPTRPSPPWRSVLLVLAGILLGVAGAAWMLAPGEPTTVASQFRPLATTAEFEYGAAWSPDGRSLAYQSQVDGKSQILIKSLDSPSPLQVTRCPSLCEHPAWSANGERLFFMMSNAIWSVGAAGGEPQIVVKDASTFALSHSGNMLAFVRRSTNPLSFSVWLSSPPGADPVRYSPEPFQGATVGFNRAQIDLAPNGRRILFWAPFTSPGQSSEFWLLPLPPGAGKARKVLESLTRTNDLEGMSWMPDSRRVVVSYQSPADTYRPHLYMADVESATVQPLVTGIGAESWPQVSHDGRRLAYTAVERDANIVEIPLAGSPVRDLIATSRMERSPSWSPRGRELTYISDRDGTDSIWVRGAERGWEKRLVASGNVPEGLDSPTFSPDGDRIAFVRSSKTGPQIWIVAVGGGTPIRLTTIEEPQLAPSWSPDGHWLAYYSRGAQGGLMKLRVGSTDRPVLLRATAGVCRYCVPEWSPKGDSIAYYTDEGTALISPSDGSAHIVWRPPFRATAWSKDGATLYGLADDAGKQRILAVDIRSGREKLVSAIDSRIHIDAMLFPGLRLSLAPDGQSLVTTAVRRTGDIWMLEDFDRPTGLLSRLRWFRK